MSNLATFALAVSLLASALPGAARGDEPLRLALMHDNGSVTVQAFTPATSREDLRYSATIVKQGRSQARTQQTGRVPIDPAAPLFTARMSVAPGERLEVDVLLERNGRPVARASRSYERAERI